MPSQIISPHEAGKTLLACLRVMQPGLSWSQCRQHLAAGRVFVNGAAAMAEARRMSSGDLVELRESKLPSALRQVEPEVVLSDEWLAVFDKPAGWLTEARPIGRRQPQEPTLSVVAARLLQQPRQRAAPVAVHRLDREASGLVMFSRQELAKQRLMEQFRTRTIERVYWAIVIGEPPEAMTLDQPLVRDRGDGRRGTAESAATPGAEIAITHVRRLATHAGLSWLECRLETGRTNQIRIHLAEAGWLIAGDGKYAVERDGTRRPDLSGAPRLVLHAHRLEWVHPGTGERCHAESPWPADLVPWVKRCFGAAAISPTPKGGPQRGESRSFP